MRQYTTSTSINNEKKGQGIPKEQLDLVKRLEGQMLEVQRRLDHAERIALLLDEMLNKDSGLNEAIDGTYEAHIFNTLRYQLFRSLISDISAAVLDDDSRTGSIRSVLKELRRCSCALDALKAYSSETTCLDIEVSGEGLSEKDKTLEIERAKKRHHQEGLTAIEERWKEVDAGSQILNTDAAKRIIWARNKVISHFDKTDEGLVGFDDIPPYGTGKFTWREPIDFMESIREYAYEVFLLVTSTGWSDDFIKANRFYVRAFWDRFKNGTTELEPDF